MPVSRLLLACLSFGTAALAGSAANAYSYTSSRLFFQREAARTNHAGHGGAPGQSGCRVQDFKFVDGGVTPVQMNVRPGAPCNFHFQSSNGDRGTFGILASSIERRPANGSVSHSSIRRYEYRPRAGYLGEDAMTIAVKYDRAGETKATVLDLSIHVQ